MELMDLNEAVKNRHAVRSYKDVAIESEKTADLQTLISECNKESGLNIQLVLNEPKAFDSLMAHYGKFSGVKNYIALVGKKGADTEEKIGYYGEKIVLRAQQLGLNTCWVAMTFKKITTAFTVNKGEKLFMVISLGYGEVQGNPHNSKPAEKVSSSKCESTPEWFIRGVQSALLAPTAMNQQKFNFTLESDGKTVSAKSGSGFYTKTDLGIAKLHFEIAAGKENFNWK